MTPYFIQGLLPATLSASLAIFVVAPFASAAPSEPETLVYKTVDGVEIEAEVYRPEGDRARPVILWIHGGALILGNRKSVPLQIVDLSRKENFTLVSIDYRLAPETRLPEIVSDLRDAMRWVREKGPGLFQADPDKLVVAGASAGGYLAQMSGISGEPPPNAIVSYWGYGDILGDWCTRANPKFGGDRPAPTREEAFAGIGERPITGTTKEDYAGRSKLFFHMKRFGKWTEIVSGIDPLESPEKLVPFCPLRNVSKDFPPLLLLHGTADPDVPVEQSIAMDEALRKAGGSVELITIERGGHGLWGGDKKKIEAAFDRSLEFMVRHLNAE